MSSDAADADVLVARRANFAIARDVLEENLVTRDLVAAELAELCGAGGVRLKYDSLAVGLILDQLSKSTHSLGAEAVLEATEKVLVATDSVASQTAFLEAAVAVRRVEAERES
jgi:hypothetical protein